MDPEKWGKALFKTGARLPEFKFYFCYSVCSHLHNGENHSPTTLDFSVKNKGDDTYEMLSVQ